MKLGLYKIILELGIKALIINKKSSQTATQKIYLFPWILQERQGLSTAGSIMLISLAYAHAFNIGVKA